MGKSRIKELFKENKFKIGFILLIIILFISFLGLYLNLQPPKIVDLYVNEELNEDHTLTMNVKFKSYTKNNWCLIKTTAEVPSFNEDEWILAENSSCSFDVKAGKYYVYVKDERTGISKFENLDVEINRILSVNLNVEETYVAFNGSFKLEASLITLGNVDETIKWTSSDEKIFTIDSGVITPVSEGDAYAIATTSDGQEKKALIHVTKLINSPVINNTKAKLKCKQYNEEQAVLLDKILANRVSNAGEGTRAGAVAAARFLSLEFPVRVDYFFENGRLNNYGNKRYVDGEGRYFHKGLYLSESKFETIVASMAGPAIWGCPLMNYQTESGYVSGVRYANGLDCSGFVSWALLNGGLDIKDSGAGDSPYRDDDMNDLGERVKLTQELVDSGKIQAGDLIGRDGHIAIIVGIDETNIYIAESLIGGVKVVQFKLDKELIRKNNYSYVMLMDSEYSSVGNGFSNMW